MRRITNGETDAELNVPYSVDDEPLIGVLTHSLRHADFGIRDTERRVAACRLVQSEILDEPGRGAKVSSARSDFMLDDIEVTFPKLARVEPENASCYLCGVRRERPTRSAARAAGPAL